MNEDIVIYDIDLIENEIDVPPTTDIAGGVIIIHDGSKQKSESIANTGESLSFTELYPNPFTNSTYIEVQHDESIELMINVYVIGGRPIENLYEVMIEKDVRYRFEFTPEAGLASDTFIVKFIFDNENVITRQLIRAK